MAKQNVGFLERHLEKIVVGVAGAILVAIAFLYAIQDPYTAEVAGESLGASALYSRIDEEAVRAVEKMRSANYESTPPPKLESPSALAVNTDMPVLPVPISPALPKVEGSIQVGKIQLVDILPPSTPQCTTGKAYATLPPTKVRVIGETEPPAPTQETAIEQDIHWVVVFATLNRKAQQGAFIKANYALDRQPLLITNVEAERQRLLPNGQWQEPAETVISYGPDVVSVRRTVDLGEQDGAPVISEANYNHINQIRTEIEPLQPVLLRPPLQPSLPEQWVLDWSVPAQMPGPTIQWAEDYGVALPEVTTDRKKIDARKIRSDAEAALQRAVEKNRDEDWLEAEKAYQQLAVNDPSIPQREQTNAKEMIEKYSSQFEPARQRIATAKQMRMASSNLLGPEIDPIWVNDLSARPGETYRYRLRVIAFNQYAGVLAKVAKPEDAAKITLAGGWSDWSEPVTLKPDKYMFVTNARDDGSSVRVEIRQWTQGKWELASQEVAVGQPVSFTSGFNLFRYDGVIVAIDPNYQYEERIPDRRGGRINYRPAKATARVTLVSRSGDDEERIAAQDMSLRRQVAADLKAEDEARQTRKAASPPSSPTMRSYSTPSQAPPPTGRPRSDRFAE